MIIYGVAFGFIFLSTNLVGHVGNERIVCQGQTKQIVTSKHISNIQHCSILQNMRCFFFDYRTMCNSNFYFQQRDRHKPSTDTFNLDQRHIQVINKHMHGQTISSSSKLNTSIAFK